MPLATDYSQLLEEGAPEAAFQSFLERHPDILKRAAGWLADDVRFHPQVNLHKFVPDFAIGTWRATVSRWEWNLVELKNPSHQLFTAEGNMSLGLNRAFRQVTDWRAWIRENPEYARKVLPDIDHGCLVTIIIGRRNRVCDSDRGRLSMLQIENRALQIRTHDWLLGLCQEIDEEA